MPEISAIRVRHYSLKQRALPPDCDDSGWFVGNPYLGNTSGLPVIRPESIPSAEITSERLFTAHCYANYNQSNQPQFVLVNNNFEFPDLLGAAYEHLIKFFADSAGK